MTNPTPKPGPLDGTMKVIKALDDAADTGHQKPATMPCPACGTGTLKYLKFNMGRRNVVRASCDTPDCVRMMS